MRKVVFIFIVAVVIFHFEYSYGQSKPSFTLQGQLRGLQDGSRLILVRSHKKRVDTLQQTKSENECFQFKGELPVLGIPYFIYVDSPASQFKSKRRFIGPILIIMEPGDIFVNGSLDDLSALNVTVRGSQAHCDYVAYLNLQKVLLMPVNEAMEQYNVAERQFIEGGKTKEDSLGMMESALALDAVHNDMKKAVENWIAEHSQSLITPWVIGTSLAGIDREYAYNNLSPVVQRSYFGLELDEVISRDKRVTVGAFAPDFSFSTAEGILLSLKDLTKTGKLTLIDFWASWCKPCRAAFPHMKELYANYHSRGLNIIGYSTDTNDNAWRKALLMELLPWPNIRETFSYAKDAYGVDRLPTLLLLDHEGKIVSRNPSKDELMRILEEKLRN